MESGLTYVDDCNHGIFVRMEMLKHQDVCIYFLLYSVLHSKAMVLRMGGIALWGDFEGQGGEQNKGAIGV